MDTEDTPEPPEDEQNSEASETKPDSDLVKVWTNLNRDMEGVSLTVYEQYADGEVAVRDEAWWTWAEFTGMKETELHISRTGTTQMNAIRHHNILTADNILDTISDTGLSLAKFGELKGTIGGEPVFDELEIPSEDEIVPELDNAITDRSTFPNLGDSTEQPDADTADTESSHA